MPKKPDVPWWASDDPWALSPAEQEAVEESRRRWREAMEATPQDPPF